MATGEFTVQSDRPPATGAAIDRGVGHSSETEE
jgi:hypothetical protein